MVKSTLARMGLERAEGGFWQRHCASTPLLRSSAYTSMAWERKYGAVHLQAWGDRGGLLGL